MKFILLLISLYVISFAAHAQVGIGTVSPDASSALDIVSDSAGILIPRMTMAERDLIGSPVLGLLIFQTDNTPGFYFYNASSIWTSIANASSLWAVNGNDINNTNTGNVGIGTTTPTSKLHIESATVAPAILNQDFESSIAPLTTGGDSGWTLQTTNVQAGSSAGVSGAYNVDNGISFIEYTLIVPADGATLSFYQAVSSEPCCDHFKFFIDNMEQSSIEGVVGYQLQTYNFVPGTYVLRWAYEKDFSVNSNNDAAYLDTILINGASPGIIRLVDGNQGDGRVLTSDVNGNAAWQQLSAQSITDFPDIVTFQQMIIPICDTSFVGETGSFVVPIKGVNTTVSWQVLVRQTTAGATTTIGADTVLLAPLRPEKLQVRYDFSPQLPFDPQGLIFAANNTTGFPDTFNLNYAAKSQNSITISITRTDIFGDQSANCWAGQFYFDVVMTD